jgi:hypothetical protein
MALSIFDIGLPLDHPSIPPDDRPKLTKRLSDLRERMRAAGYCRGEYAVSSRTAMKIRNNMDCFG